MVRWSRVRAGAAAGALAGLLYVAADATGAWLAIGALMDPGAVQALLLSVAAVGAALAGAALGAVLGVLWPGRWSLRARPALLAGVAALACGAIVAGGYRFRVGRRPEPLGPPSAVAAPGAPSVLLVVVDALRADALYGPELDFPLTPRFGAWARGRVIARDVEAAASWTIPSTATILTGILPERHYAARGYLPDWAPTLAERFRAAGYDTVGLVDNALLERRNGFTAGFATWIQRSALRFAFSLPAFRALPDRLQHALRNGLRGYEQGALRLTALGVDAIRAPRERPLFLYVHYMEPHEPYYPHPEIAPDPPEATAVDPLGLMLRTFRGEAPPPTPGELAFLRHRYAGEVRSLDGPLTQLCEAFEHRYGPAAVIAVTADHGEELFDRGELGHGHSLYRELVHVPLVLSLGAALPEARRRAVIDAPQSLVDLAPTLLDAARVGPTVGAEGVVMDGASRLAALRGEEPFAPLPLFASSNLHGRRIYLWREGQRVLLITFRGGHETRRAFDLAADPLERQELDDPGLLDAMDARMQVSNAAQVRGRDPRAGDSRSDLEGLRALGYTQ